jgi:hypothetical protein
MRYVPLSSLYYFDVYGLYILAKFVATKMAALLALATLGNMTHIA